jgi:hypothetical protein
VGILSLNIYWRQWQFYRPILNLLQVCWIQWGSTAVQVVGSWKSETCGKPSILTAPATDFLEQRLLRDAQPAKCNLPKYEPWGARSGVTLGRGLFILCGNEACLLTWWLSFCVNETKSMKQSPSWEANSSSASQEILSILWDPKVHYHIHKCLPHGPIMSVSLKQNK